MQKNISCKLEQRLDTYRRLMLTDLSLCLFIILFVSNYVCPLYMVIVSGSSSLIGGSTEWLYYQLLTERSVRSFVELRRRSLPPENVATLTNVNRFFIIFLFTCQTIVVASTGLVNLQGDTCDCVLGLL